MPESLKVELAERTIQCGEEFIDLKVFSEMADIAEFWNSSMDVGCDGQMGMNVSESYPSGAGLVISEEAVTGCTAYASVPVAVDAAVFSFSFLDIYELNFSPELIIAITSGQVTNWSDEWIQRLNPEAELPDLPINLITSAPEGAISAMQLWVSSATGKEADFSIFTPSKTSEVDALYEMMEGDLKLTSFGALQIASMTYANMLMDESDPSSVVLPDILTITTGTAQTIVSGQAPNLSFVYDPSIPAPPLPGAFEPILPWSALFPVKMFLCGDDDLNVRYVARFVLRLDAQGSIPTGVFNPLKEEVRVAAISVVDDGLPEVEISEELQRELQR
jgi:phosphate transport system substrate-binding protein